MTAREAFCAGERPDDILVYLADGAVSDPEALGEHGESVTDGTVLVLPGESARDAFRSATGIDPMAFARQAGDTEGDVERTLLGATCPAEGSAGDGHDTRFIFAFAEPQNEAAGGLYAEGDVIHAYVACTCGETYSDRWVAGSEGA